MIRSILIGCLALAMAACTTTGAPDCAKLLTGKNAAMTAATAAAIAATGAQLACGPNDDPASTGCKVAKVTAEAATLASAAAKSASDLYDRLCPATTAYLPITMPVAEAHL